MANQAKFQTGDRVRVNALRLGEGVVQHGGNIPEHYGQEYQKKIFTIDQVRNPDKSGHFGYTLDNKINVKQRMLDWIWDERLLTRVRKAKVVPIKKEEPIPVPPAQPREFQVGDRVVFKHGYAKGIDRKQGVFVITRLKVANDPAAKWLIYTDRMPENPFFDYRYEFAPELDKKQGVKPPGKILPVPEAKPVPPPPVIKSPFPKVRKELADTVIGGGGIVGTCSYAKQFKDGTMVLQYRDACHARVPQWGDTREITALTLQIAGHMKDQDKEWCDMYKEYINYIMNYSPWSPSFHRYGVDNALKHGVLMNVERPIGEIIGACVALREGSEYSAKLAPFYDLIKKGYSGNVAYLLSCSLTFRNGVFMYSPINNAHRVLDGDMDSEKLFTFFKEGYDLKGEDAKPYRTNHHHYRGIACFVAPDGFGEKPKINTFLSKELAVVAGGGWGASFKVETKNVYSLADKLEPLLNKF